MSWLKSNRLYFSLAVFFLAVFLLSGCDNSKDNTEVDNQTNKQVEAKQDTPKESESKKEDTQPPAKDEKDDKKPLSDYSRKNNLIKQELINKYQAVDLSEIKPKYTLEISKEIGQKKVFLKAEMQDVYIRGNKYYVRIKSSLFHSEWADSSDYVADLECSKDFADYVIGNKDAFGMFGKEFFVIAEINEVSKPSLEISASPISEEEAEIKLDSSEYLFIFKGKLIDFRFGEERLP